MISFKFSSPDLADYVEGWSPEQIKIALEAAIRIVFSPLLCQTSGIPLVGDEAETVVTDADYEEVIISSAIVDMSTVAMGSQTPQFNLTEEMMELLYAGEDLESEAYRDPLVNLINKLTEDITDDKYNTDIGTICSEVCLGGRPTLVDYKFITPQDHLHLWMTFPPESMFSLKP